MVGSECERTHPPRTHVGKAVEGRDVPRRDALAREHGIDDAVAKGIGQAVGNHRRQAVEGVRVEPREGEG